MNLAPNGKPSNLTNEQYKLVRTKAFKDWFGDWDNYPENSSKVVDENGEPLVVYRGMAKQSSKKYIFTYKYYQIKQGGRRNKFGFYFTDSFDVAKGYAQDHSKMKIIEKYKNIYKAGYSNQEEFDDDAKSKAIVLNYFIKIEKYLDLREYKLLSYVELLKILNQSDYEISKFVEKHFKFNKKYAYSERLIYELFITEKDEGEDSISLHFKNLIIKKYNGVIFEEDTFKKSDVYVVFDSNQIKLADGTNTTFDRNNPDIRYNKGGQIKEFIYTIGGL